MIFLLPDAPWPSNAPAVSLSGILVEGVVGRRTGPATVPVPFPAVLNAAISEFERLCPHAGKPTHVLVGPKAFERFEEYFNFSRSMRGARGDEDAELGMLMVAEDVATVNKLVIVRTVEEGMQVIAVVPEK